MSKLFGEFSIFSHIFIFRLKTGILSALMISSESSFQIDVQLGKNDFLYNSILHLKGMK